MRNLLYLFVKYGHFLVFVGLELFCLFLIVRYNRSQRDIWINSTNIVAGTISDTFDGWTEYLNLKEESERLAKENAQFKARRFNQRAKPSGNKDTISTDYQQYTLIPAEIINKSIDKPDNYFTLNKGRKHGVKPDMGVISSNGIIGIVKTANEEYSRVLTILHRQSAIVAANKNNDAFGTLKWKDFDYRKINLIAYPKHQPIEVGDTIVTSGYSTHFPKGHLVGIVEEVSLPKSDYFYDITIALSNELYTVDHVYVIDNLKQLQQLEVEREDE